MWSRRLATAALVTLTVGTLATGCSVQHDGWLAVGRVDDGTFRVYLRTCTHPVDGATLYWPDDPEGANSEEEVFAEWRIEAGHGGPIAADWPLLGTANGIVTAATALEAVPEPPKNLAIYAWTVDATTTVSGPYLFTAADLARLRPGQLLVENTGVDEDQQPNIAITQEAFNNLDCTELR